MEHYHWTTYTLPVESNVSTAHKQGNENKQFYHPRQNVGVKTIYRLLLITKLNFILLPLNNQPSICIQLRQDIFTAPPSAQTKYPLDTCVQQQTLSILKSSTGPSRFGLELSSYWSDFNSNCRFWILIHQPSYLMQNFHIVGHFYTLKNFHRIKKNSVIW